MKITDEMVERAAEAAYMADIFRLRTESDIWLEWKTLAKAAPTTAAERYRTMARAALAAALGDVEPQRIRDLEAQVTRLQAALGNAEPLEDVVWESGVTEIRILPCWWRDKDQGGTGFAVTAISGDSVADEVVEDTIDASIRAAVANAKG